MEALIQVFYFTEAVIDKNFITDLKKAAKFLDVEIFDNDDATGSSTNENEQIEDASESSSNQNGPINQKENKEDTETHNPIDEGTQALS